MKAWQTLKSLYQLKQTLLPSKNRYPFPKTLIEVLLIAATMLSIQHIVQQLPAAPAFLATLPVEQFRLLSTYFAAVFIFGALPLAYGAVLLARLVRMIKSGFEAYKTAKEMQAWMQSLATFSASEQD